MVSLRCIRAGETELNRLNIRHNGILLGGIQLAEELPISLRAKLSKIVALFGSELIYDRKFLTIERIQNAIMEMFNLCRQHLSNKFKRTTGFTVSSFQRSIMPRL